MFGAPVLLRPSWFVVAALVTVLYVPAVHAQAPAASAPLAYLVAATFALMLLGSVFLHELAHAVAARRVGTPPTHIVLDVWGGHTAFSDELPTPGRSIFVAAVGPITNAVIAVLATQLRSALQPQGVTSVLLLALALSNWFVAGFNALPGLPLDGGRVLEGLVWSVTGERTTGSLVAGWCGRVVAVGAAGYVVARAVLTGASVDLTTVVWMLLVASVLWQGATQAIRAARWRRRAPAVSAAGLLRPAVAVPAAASVAEVVVAANAAGVGEVVVLDPDGRPSGLVDAAAVAAVPPERAGSVRVGAVARALPPGASLAVELSGEDLLAALQSVPHPEYVVVAGGARVVGVLRWGDVQARLVG